MVKRLIWGGIAVAAAFGAQRMAGSLSKDLRRYDRFRAMSGDPPFVFEMIGKVPALLVALPPLIESATTEAAKLLTSIPSDALRYARIKSM